MPTPKVNKELANINHDELVTPATTPVENKPGEMKYLEAMQAVMDGKKVTRMEWKNPSEYVWMDNGYLRIMLADGKHDLIVRDVDMLGIDWVIVE